MEFTVHGIRELLEQARDFERVIKTNEKYCYDKESSSRTLSVFFAMKSAFLIRANLKQEDNDQVTSTIGTVEDIQEKSPLPKFDTVHSALQKLATALSSNNTVAAMAALEEMKVFALCPIPTEQLLRLEQLAQVVSGRARLVFLVELSLFAVELGNLKAARRYVTEAWGLAPGGWELYIFNTLEGFFATEAGKTKEAIHYLEESLRACLIDEHTLINCSLRPPSFLLAQRLVELGEREAVLKHFANCKNVWRWRWMPLNEWINLIECGSEPDFGGSEGLKGMSQLSCRLDLQWMRVRALENETGLDHLATLNSKSFAEVVAAKEKLFADLHRHISSLVKDSISYLDNDIPGPSKR